MRLKSHFLRECCSLLPILIPSSTIIATACTSRHTSLACALLSAALACGTARGEAVPVTDRDRNPVLSGCEPDYPPYCIATADGHADGFSVELLRAALKAVGRDVEFKTGPRQELKQSLADGRLQALPLMGRTSERDAVYDFTFPYLTLHGAIIVRQDCKNIHSIDDLKGKQVAVLRGDMAEEYLGQVQAGAVVVPSQSFEAALRELSAGKHDAVVIQKLLAFQLMQKARLKNLTTAGPPLKDFAQSYSFATRKGDHDLLAALNEGLSIIMADGTFRALYAKWFSTIESLGRTKSRIVVGGDSHCPPYEFLDQNGQPAGFNVDLTRAIARRMGLSVDIRLGTSGIIRKALSDGEVDVVQGMFFSAERDKEFDFSPPITVIQYAVVVRDSPQAHASMKALAGKAILVMAGDIMEDWTVKQGYAKPLVAVPTQEEALRLLASGKGDCALVAKLPALYWTGKNGWSNLRVSHRSVLSAESCYAVLNGQDELLSQFSEGLAALKATGEYRNIQAKWLGPYEAETVSASLRTYGAYALAIISLLLLLLGGALLWSRSLQRQVAERTRSLTAGIAELKRAELEREVTIEFLRLVNETAETAELIRKSVLFFQKNSGCDAVGLRLREGDDYPYYLASGFPDEFVAAENHLCQRDSAGQPARDSAGNPVIECMCGNVLCGRVDPSKPFFTAHGSFWTNCTTELLASTSEADRLARSRNRCTGEGYESVALIPLRLGEDRVGLLQLNNRAKGAFSLQTIELWERLVDNLAVALSHARTQEALSASEETHRSLFENMLNGLAYCRMLYKDGVPCDFVYLSVNRAFETHTGLKDVVGKKVSEAIPGICEADPELLEIYGRVASTGKAEVFERYVSTLKMWFHISAYSPKQGFFVAVFDTITERKRAEEALRESETRLRTLGDNIPGGVLYQLLIPSGGQPRYTYLSAGIERIFGISAESVLADPTVFWQLIVEEDRPRIDDAQKRSARDMTLFECEFRQRTSTGEIKWFQARSTPHRLEDGSILWDGVLADINERKQTEDALRESETRFRSLIESAPEAILVQSGGQFVYLNPAMLRLFGASRPEELLGTNLMDRIAPEYHEVIRERIQMQRVTGKSVPLMDQEYVRLDGSRVPVETTAVPIRFQNRDAHLVFVRDTTARKQAESERERLMAAIGQSSEVVVITDPAGTIQYVNPAFERITGYTRAEAVGQNPCILKSGQHDAAFYGNLWKTLTSGQTWAGRIVNKRKDGTLYTEEATISPVRDASGSTVNYVAVKRDITEHLQLSTQLQQAQKMDSVGRLAGGVAHDFNNMLAVILGNTELALSQTDPTQPLFSDLQEIRKAAERSADLTKQLLAFARKQAVTPKVLDLNDTVVMMLKMLRRLIGENIELSWQPGAGDATVKIDPTQIDQILVNLAVNARDAIGGVGEVIIETGNVTFDQAFCAKNADAVPGDYVMLSFSDDGCGMDETTLEHIFEPFFTTKNVGKGTGLGLATVYGIVKQNRGIVTVSSETGHGTTFRIYLPKHLEMIGQAQAKEPIETLSLNHETVLLVEDEPAILKLGKRMLESLGYRVQTASLPSEAISWAETQTGDIHLLLTDVIMPEMTGWDLAKWIRLLYPNIGLLFMSGYTSDAISQHEMLSSGAYLIQKPFTKKDLAAKVAEILKRTQESPSVTP